MHKTKFNIGSTIRFRRWSRVGYAVFCSLASIISIGTLAVSVSDKTLQKLAVNNFACFTSESIIDKESAETSQEQLGLEASLHLIQNAALSLITFDSAAACGQTTTNIINCNG